MKRLLVIVLFVLNLAPMAHAENNPLLSKFKTPHETPPFDKIKTSHIEPAIDKALAEMADEIQIICDNPETPTFENTILAYENAGKLLNKVAWIYFNLRYTNSDDEMMQISRSISPKLSKLSNDIFLNEKLFARIRTIYNQRAQLNLSTEDARLLQDMYDSFKEKGATLNKEDKETYRRLSTELSMLNLKFDQNELMDRNRFELLITNEKELEGLPESAREAAADLAKSKGKEGWLFNLSAPSYVPFLRYSANRELRKQLYYEYMSVGNHDNEYDNKEVIRQITTVRLQIARLMGFEDYATYALQHTMAQKPAQVYNLLNQLLDAYKPVALNEYNAVQGFATGMEQTNITVMPWDWNYYSEKLKDIRFQVNDEMTRPYFELNRVTEGIFGLATQLYGVTFRENKKIPVYHPEVKAYEVFDADGRFLSVFYTDFHPRDSKQSGAWMNNIMSQFKTADGKDHRPQVIIVMNFTRPTATKPSLLTFDEVETFLHEFGHALHGMLTDCTYSTLSGTNVYRDFGELPSQIMENWLTEKEFLDQIAVHYETGEKIPMDLVQKLIDAANYNIGNLCLRQLSFGLLDMAWHTLKTPYDGDIIAFEKKAWKPTSILPDAPGALMSSSFGHIFAGGYAAGYYGYKWAEVLDADAFAAFQEAGIFDKEVARSFRDNILSKGGTEDPSVLYKRFRGKDATIDALLIRNGIKK